MQPSIAHSEFSKWRINLDHYCLENEKGEEIFVEPRLLKLLDFLTANASRIVKRNEIVDHVWRDVIVTEESLSKAVFDLRKFLDNHFKNAPQIKTIRGVGYRLERIEKRDTLLYRVARMGAKVVAYVLAIALVLSIVVRALRYEN